MVSINEPLKSQVLSDAVLRLPGLAASDLLDAVFASLGAAVYAADHHVEHVGRVLAANPQCTALLGYSVDELVGASIHDLVHHHRPDGSPLPADQCPLLKVWELGRAQSGQDTFWRKDGTALPVAWAGAPLHRDGVLVGTVVSFTDDTQRQQLAQAREQVLSREHDTALELQRALLTNPPHVPGLQFAVRYLAGARGAEVGGDWYDAFTEADGSTLVVIGDVIGHDTRAAAAMGQLRGLLRGIAYAAPDQPAVTLHRLELAAEALNVSTLATIVLARVHPAASDGSRQLQWANAGHPPPLILHGDGTARWLDPPHPDLTLGALTAGALLDPALNRTTHTTTLHAGQTLLLYTDGLIERRTTDLNHGLNQLAGTAQELADLPLEDLLDQLLRQLADQLTDPAAGQQPNTHPFDDIAVLAVRPTR